MKTKFLLLIIIGFFSVQLSAQEYLYLLKKGTTKSKVLLVHDIMSVKIIGSDDWSKGEITNLYPDKLELDYVDFIKYDTISEIRMTNKTQKQFGNGFRKGAILYTGILLINGAITNSSPLIPKNHGIAAASMYAFGWGLHFLSKKKYPLDLWRIEYINLDFQD